MIRFNHIYEIQEKTIQNQLETYDINKNPSKTDESMRMLGAGKSRTPPWGFLPGRTQVREVGNPQGGGFWVYPHTCAPPLPVVCRRGRWFYLKAIET